MAGLDDIREERLKKVKLLRDQGIDPYPATSERTHDNATFLAKFADLDASQETLTISGRIMSLRGQGGIIFADLFDGTARVQALIKKDELGDELFSLFEKAVDAGDFIEVTGTTFTTNRGVQSLLARSWRMLTKSLRPVPTEWFGLKDEDDRYRKRYLDMLLNSELRELFVKKSRFWQSVRNFLTAEGFMEVETPVLENTTGGADARPFKTHHNALDIDVYLRISAGELWQKRLMVAGYPKVFELGRIFRNEGMSAEHLQDYTQIEFYWAYADYEKGMDLVERMYKQVAHETFGTLMFTIGEHTVDLGKEWKRFDYTETIRDMAGVDIEHTSLPELEQKLAALEIGYSREGWNESRAIDLLWKYCRRRISGPGFLINVPKSLSVLAKTDPRNPRVTQRFQPIIAGSELGNGYSELNDPLDQKERFDEQQKLRDAGDEEAQMADDDYVEALEYGMPPTCGYGMSERVFAFLANSSVREAQTFPLMKPRS